MVASFEARILFGSPLTPGGVVAHPSASVAMIAIHVRISSVADLCDPTQAAIIDTNAQELTGDWRGYAQRSSSTSVTGPVGKAPTQEFGEQLFSTCPDVKGFLSISSQIPYCKVLVVFPQRLVNGVDSVSYSFVDDTGVSQTKQIP